MKKAKGHQADLIIPVFNEAQILETFYHRVSNLGLYLNLIFIDNNSSDNSVSIIESFPNAILIKHTLNEGYGGSLIDGMKQCKSDNVIIIDADCEYPPEVIPDILASLAENDVVYASRLLERASASDANMPLVKLVGNKVISGLFNSLFHQNTTDLYTGCKGFRRKCIEGLSFNHKGFEHVLEFACKISQQGYRIVDIPIEYAQRSTGKSKMSHLSETVKFLILLLFFRVSKRRQS